MAPVYTTISRLVFGDLIHQATTCYLSKIPNKSVIIIGGGKGMDFVPYQKELNGEYWELSSSMLSRARVNLSKSDLKFRLGDFSTEDSQKFQLAILPFVLDTMTDGQIIQFLNSLKMKISTDGQVLVSDFYQSQSVKHKLIQRLMITFFQLLTSHSRGDLPQMEELMNECGFQLLEEKSWKKGWIKAQVYTRKD